MHIEIILAIIFFVLAAIGKAMSKGAVVRTRKNRWNFEERDYLSKLHDPTTVEGDVFLRTIQYSRNKDGFLKGPLNLG